MRQVNRDGAVNLNEEAVRLVVDEASNHLTYKTASFELSKITGPTALIRILYAINGFTMSFSFSKLGDTELAAAGLITAGQLLIYNSFSGAGRSSGILITGKHKEKNDKAVSELFHHSLLYSGTLGILATAAVLIVPFFYSAIKQPKDVVSVVRSYFFPFAIGMLSKLLLTNLRDFSFATKSNLIPLLSVFIEQALTAGIGYCATTGELGMSKHGVIGYAYVSSFVSALSLAVYIIYLAFNRNTKKYHLFQSFSLYNASTNIKKLATLGSPIGFRIFCERAAVAFATIMAGWLGEEALSAQEIALQYMLFIIVPFYGVGRGMGILVRRYRDSKTNIRKLNTIGIGVALMVSASALIIYASFAKPLIRVFLKGSTKNRETILNIAKRVLLIMSVTEIFDCSRSVLEGSLRGIEKTCYTMIANLTTIWCIGAPTSYLLGFKTKLHLSGIFIGRGIGIVLGCSLLFYKWLKDTNANQTSGLEKGCNYYSTRCFSFFSFRRTRNFDEIEELEEKTPFNAAAF